MDTQTYYQQWYEKNKLILSAKRKQRYQTDLAYRAAYNTKHLQRYQSDPDYREKVLLQQRSYRQKCSRVNKKKKFFKIAFNGKLYQVNSRKYSRCFIGSFVDSLATWEKKGLIPLPIFPAKFRYYTYVQLGLILEFGGLMKCQQANPKSEKIATLLKQQTLKMYHHWYDGSLEDHVTT